MYKDYLVFFIFLNSIILIFDNNNTESSDTNVGVCNRAHNSKISLISLMNVWHEVTTVFSIINGVWYHIVLFNVRFFLGGILEF